MNDKTELNKDMDWLKEAIEEANAPSTKDMVPAGDVLMATMGYVANIRREFEKHGIELRKIAYPGKRVRVWCISRADAKKYVKSRLEAGYKLKMREEKKQ